MVCGYFSIYIYTESDRATEEKRIGHLPNEDAHALSTSVSFFHTIVQYFYWLSIADRKV